MLVLLLSGLTLVNAVLLTLVDLAVTLLMGLVSGGERMGEVSMEEDQWTYEGKRK